jgi:hypothetical protein
MCYTCFFGLTDLKKDGSSDHTAIVLITDDDCLWLIMVEVVQLKAA